MRLVLAIVHSKDADSCVTALNDRASRARARHLGVSWTAENVTL